MTIELKDKIKAQSNFSRLLASYGGEYASLARAVNVAPATVRKWKERGYVSLEGARQIEAQLNGKFLAIELRPDIAKLVSIGAGDIS